MTPKLTEIEKRVLAVIQNGFPITESPYADMAQQAGLETDVFLDVLKNWQAQKKLRRIGAIVNHFRVDMGGGAMVVWRVPVDEIEAIGKQLAGFVEVSHAYQRPTKPTWPYNLYTMVHAADAEDTEMIVARMSEACGITDYHLLVTEKELKKVPPTYIIIETERSGSEKG